MSEAASLSGNESLIKTNNRTVGSFVLAVLGLCAATLTCFPLLRLRTYAALNYNEGWNAYRDQMAALHQPLYGSPPGYGITNYPFLSFHIVGALSRFTGNVNIAGRVIDLASLFVVSLLIAGIVREIQGSWRTGMYAGLCFYVWVCTYTPDNLAINDPQMLGSAFSMLGLYAYVRGTRRPGWLLLSAFAFAASVFTKDNLIAFPVAIAFQLIIERRWRPLLIWTSTGVATACVLLLATIQIDGHYFLSHLLLSRSARYGRGLDNIEEFLARFYAPIVIGIVWLAWAKSSTNRTLILSSFSAAIVFVLLFAFGNGVGKNIFYDALIAIALAVGVAISDISSALPKARTSRALSIMVVALPALTGIAFAPLTFFEDVASWHKMPRIASDAVLGVNFIKAIPGPILCENLLLCYDAGKPMVYDAYFVRDQIRAHHLRESKILAEIQTQHYGAIEIDGAPNEPIAPQERNRFSAAFMQTLFSRYRPVLQTPNFTIFRPL